ncbi:GNAT family N-acetyltransferase [Clostridium estertheticum]|uniref:GNAT family N-acetyltransferase n=1 Tax=Clostridium estertheticum TaxID=238834 RepID=UPI0013E95860|nr:GNAT family N-acetyltransferase [Clostridium estertheticum]MBZ9685856.1 GNAT family N-acetyltransferase [Clostridium estertheticum]
MLTKATEKHRELIMNYCLAEPNINLFIIGDIENFGFETDFQEVWIQTLGHKLVGVVLRYHDNFIIYSKDLDLEINEIEILLSTRDVNIISGKLTVIDLFYPVVKSKYSKRDMYFCQLLDISKLIEDTSEVETAESIDAMEISLAYEQIEEFSGLYSSGIDSRYKQIASRIKTKEGVHMFIKKDGKIVSHGNTTAETSVSAMVGGILTIPAYRKQGLSSKIISALCQNLFLKGKSACLFFDNPEAGEIYHKLGFRNIDNWAILGRK